MTSGLCHRSGPEGVDFGIVSEAPSEGSCVAGWRVSPTGRSQGQVELLTKLRGKPKLPAAHGVWGGSSPVGALHMLSKKLWSLGILPHGFQKEPSLPCSSPSPQACLLLLGSIALQADSQESGALERVLPSGAE